ncbi:MAG: phosphatidate cytidylyltransferase [Elusimicrobiota bacterium]
MLLPRILTAAVGIPLFIYLIKLGSVPYLSLIIGLSVIALHEYATILWVGGRGIQRSLTVIGGAAVALAVALDGTRQLEVLGLGLTHIAVTGVVVIALLSEVLRREHSLDRAALSVFGTVLIGWTLAHLVLIRDLSPNGEALTFLLFVAVWVTDSFAYFAGRALGRTKLAKVISPKKTWEGAAGGLLGAVATVWLARRFFMPDILSPFMAVGLGLLIGTLGQVSDLSQSLIKRAAGAKDSSHLLPGHGGVFDRMDSFLLLAPVFYYVLLAAGL